MWGTIPLHPITFNSMGMAGEGGVHVVALQVPDCMNLSKVFLMRHDGIEESVEQGSPQPLGCRAGLQPLRNWTAEVVGEHAHAHTRVKLHL